MENLMQKHTAITKRQEFIIRELHKISELRELGKLNKQEALKRAEQIKEIMVENIAPFIVWQNAINTLIKELRGK